jgi:hypothetical protein
MPLKTWLIYGSCLLYGCLFVNVINSTLGFHIPVISVGGSRQTQFHLSAPKTRCGRPGNSRSLKQSGPLILRRAQGALKLIADVAQTANRYDLLPGFNETQRLNHSFKTSLNRGGTPLPQRTLNTGRLH